MSNKVNDEVLQVAQETIDLAQFHMDYWETGTPFELLDLAVAQVIKHLDDNNLEDLYYVSLPHLNDKILESSKLMFDLEYNPDDPEARQVKAEEWRDMLREDGHVL